MAPISENLFREDQPAISRPSVPNDEIAMAYKMPIFRSAAIMPFPKGITAKTMSGGATTRTGAML